MEVLCRLRGHAGTIHSIRSLRIGESERVFSASADRSLRVWSMENKLCAQVEWNEFNQQSIMISDSRPTSRECYVACCFERKSFQRLGGSNCQSLGLIFSVSLFEVPFNKYSSKFRVIQVKVSGNGSSFILSTVPQKHGNRADVRPVDSERNVSHSQERKWKRFHLCSVWHPAGRTIQDIRRFRSISRALMSAGKLLAISKHYHLMVMNHIFV